MLPDRVSNPGPLTYESGALPIALRSPAAVFLSIQERWPFGCFFQNFGPVLSDFLYLDYRWSSQATVHAW